MPGQKYMHPKLLSIAVKRGLFRFVKSLPGKYPDLVFIIAVSAASLLFYYHIIVFSPPQSVHRWRQTDSASIALNYYMHGMKFFRPETHSLSSDGNKTGYAAGEFPLLYYSVAALYKIFGPHDAVFRIFNMLIFFSGLYALFRTSLILVKDTLSSVFVVMLIFSSPAAAYYGCNFLPDSAALAMVFWGWFFFFKQHRSSGRNEVPETRTRKEKDTDDSFNSGIIEMNRTSSGISVFFFTLAALLKITMAISLGTLLILLAFESFRNRHDRKLKFMILQVITGFILTGLWYLYAIRFNSVHSSTVFLTSVTPWWAADPEKRKEITSFIIDRNLNLYFSYGMIVFVLICLFILVFLRKNISRPLKLIIVSMLAGGFIYANLWYNQFQYHDYYFIVLLAPVALLLAGAIAALPAKWKKLRAWPLAGVAMTVFIIFNIIHARDEMKLRYFGWKREAPVYEDYFDIRPYLLQIGIKETDRVISIPDVTNCYTLYMMNRSGNNLPGINETTDTEIRKFINFGARYIFVNDSSLLKDPALGDFVKNEAGSRGTVHIFRLQ
jgi:hypothetical protein